MKIGIGAVSMAVIALAMHAPAFAQDDTVDRINTEASTDKDKDARLATVVVTGSAIRGTPEDAALPVNVYSAQDLELQGSPSGLEFAKELTQAGPTNGESNYFGGGNLIGAPAFNLRGIGADKTLTLLNGRRVSENISNIPQIALERTEVLKDGAAVIYGADAVGGVVNFITRENFTGIEAKSDYRYVDGSDGEWDMGVLFGFGEDKTNFMVSAEWEHRSRLETEERGFSSLPYDQNATAWSFLTNLARYLPRTAGGTTIGSLYDYDQSDCESQGGIFAASAPGGNACMYGYWSYYNLVEEQDIYRIYAQVNSEINDHTNFHAEVAYGEVKVPNQFNSPSLPTTQGPGVTTGATYQYTVPVENPYSALFAQQTGWDQSALYGLTDYYSIILLRPFAHGGQSVTSGGVGNSNSASVDNEIWRVSATLDGTLGDKFGALSDIGYDFGVTYNSQVFTYEDSDYLGFRLQEALNGFGGVGCNPGDLDPTRLGTQNDAAAGQGACMWFNPFSSSYPMQPELGLANPNYVPGMENDPALIAWLFDPRHAETYDTNLTVDLVFNGLAPGELPGGKIGWAAGAQWRQDENHEFNPSPFLNGQVPCAWPVGQRPLPNNDPDFNGCTLNKPGPFGFYGLDEAEAYDRQSMSYFLETSLPVLDNLNFQAAVRREEFSGGLSATVYKVSGKWNIFGPLSLRGSYGTNFQAPDIDLQPGSVSNIVRAYDRAGNAWLAAQEVTRSDIEPEKAKSWNMGLIWQQDFGSQNLNVIIDYFDIHTEGEIGQLATNNQIANAVFDATTKLADCSSPFIDRILFNNTDTSPGGVCTQGSSFINDLNNVITDIGNGSDQLTSGFDFQINYSFPVSGGQMTLGSTGTYLTELKTTARMLDGVEVAPADDRLGYVNFSSIAFSAPELRANAFVNFNRDRHNARLTARYVSGLTDERGPWNPIYGERQPGTSTPISGHSNGVKVDASLRFDATYVYELNDNWTLNGTVRNILDEDPPFVRTEFGYDPRTADPLGRVLQIGVKAKF